jgi:hypothetical protein
MDYIDLDYYVQLAAMDPVGVCRRAACQYDAADNSYILQVWGDEYAIYPGEGSIVNRGMAADPPHAFFPLFIVYYLLKCEEIDPLEKWISEKDLPGGVTFFRGPHEIPTRLISGRFGNDPDAFAKVCTRIGKG